VSTYRNIARSTALPLLVFAVSAAVYLATLGPLVKGTSSDAHYVHLANSFLHGQLSLVDAVPPNNNDWARFRGRWYVSFPPLPALLILPAVAVWGTAVWDRLFWAIVAGFGPMFVYLLLRYLRLSGRSGRSVANDLVLTALFAFGTVYYFTAVQGTTWFAAHLVCNSALALYLFFAIGARKPFLAGLFLGLCFLTRVFVARAGIFFVVEVLSQARRSTAVEPSADTHPLLRAFQWLMGVRWGLVWRPLIVFAVPLALITGGMLWVNILRFDDPFEFGHTYLQIKWSYRIGKWGLLNYHYLAQNLAVFLAALPWINSVAPFIKISRHGLALWFTTPQLLLVLWPKRVTATMVGLTLSVAVIALIDLCYQNSGWVQFGYRFSLDYLVMIFVLLALGGRRFGPIFHLLLVFAFAVNCFGALTFERVPKFYDTDPTQRVIFQPD
jgi:hypothetical protein